MKTRAEIDPVADAFFAALEAGSVEGVIACYAPDAKIWHNFDRITLTPETNVAGLETLFAGFPTRRYVEVRRSPTETGFVQQQVLSLVRADGVAIDWPGCIICDVENNRITKLDEYVDIVSLSQPAG